MKKIKCREFLSISIIFILGIFLAGCTSDSDGESGPEGVSLGSEETLSLDSDSMGREVSEVTRKFLDTVYRDGDARSALPMSCGYMKNIIYIYTELPKDQYQNDSHISIGEPTVTPSPEMMPSATVKITESVDGKSQSAFLTLYREVGVWRVCDQTEINRSEVGL